MKRIISAALVIPLLGLFPQSEVSPREIVLGHFEACGGLPAVKALETAVIKQSNRNRSTDQITEFQYYFKKPYLVRGEISSSGGRITIFAYDGTMTWTADTDAVSGAVLNARRLPNEHPLAVQTREKSKFGYVLFPMHLLEKDEGALLFIGNITRDRRDLAHIRLSEASSSPEDYYFDNASGLLWMREDLDAQGRRHTSEYFEYRKVGDLLVPFMQLNRGPLPGSSGEGCIEQRIVDIRFNEPLSDGFFRMPGDS